MKLRFGLIYGVVLILVFLYACKENKYIETTEKFETGQTKYIGLKDKITGEIYGKEYYVNGNLYCEFRKENGLYEDTAKFYYEGGELEVYYVYSKGKKNGQSVSYYPNGNIKESLSYVNDKRDGDSFFYLPNGKLKAHNIFFQDVILYKEVFKYDADHTPIDTQVAVKPFITTTPICPKIGDKLVIEFSIPIQIKDFQSDSFFVDVVLGVIRNKRILFDHNPLHERIIDGKFVLSTTAIDSMTISGELVYGGKVFEGFVHQILPCK